MIVVILVSMIIFLLVRLLPGDPLLLYVSGGDISKLSPEAVAAAREKFGLDQPIYAQYWEWVKGLFQGDLGISLTYDRPVSTLLATRIPVTVNLGLVSFVLSTVLGVLAGIASAMKRGKWQDNLITTLANIGICVPTFWLAIMLMYIFGYKLGWLPLTGYTSPFQSFWPGIRQMIMPVFCMMLFDLAFDARQMRSSVLEVVHKDYIRTALAKGIPQPQVTRRHILKNAILPVVSIKGIAFANIIGGSVFVERIFGINGVGRLAADAVSNSDYAVIQAIVLLTSVTVVVANTLVDIIYGWLDPKIRQQ